MTGIITAANIHWRYGPSGGLIRVGADTDRIPFGAAELVDLRLAECLGRTVNFDCRETRDGPIAYRVRAVNGEPR